MSELHPNRGLPELGVVSSYPGFGIPFFYMVKAYLDLIESLTNLIPTPGLVRYYNYKTGTLQHAVAQESDLNDSGFRKQLVTFATSGIVYNIHNLCDIFRSAIQCDITARNGIDRYLSGDVIDLMHKFGKHHAKWDSSDSTNLWNLSQKLFVQAHKETLSSNSQTAPIRTVELELSNDQVLAFFENVRGLSLDFRDYKKDALALLKVFYYLACCYYQISPTMLLSIRKMPNFKEAIKITDSTLAAIPLSPYFITSCADRETPSSTNAIIYMTALGEVYQTLIAAKEPDSQIISVEPPARTVTSAQ